MRRYLMIIAIALSALSAAAAEKFEFYSGARMLAMGGAAVAVANDETGIFSNPASLGKLRDPFLTVVDPELHWGGDTTSFVSGFDLNIIGLQNVLEKINEHPGRHFHLKAQVFPSIVVPNFAAGVFIKYEVNGDLDSTNSEIDFDFTNDMTAVLGYNLRFWEGRVKVGFSGRYINRSQIRSANGIPTSNLVLQLGDVAENGGAVAFDGGLLLTMPWKLLPTLGIVARDIGNTTFGLGGGLATGNGTRPQTVKQSVDAAIAFFPIAGNRTRTAITAEMRDILSEDADDKADIYRRIHAGLEVNINDIFFIRGGMNQRYWTAGLEFAIKNFQFQATSYGEEIGDATTKREDRRYVGKFAYRF